MGNLVVGYLVSLPIVVGYLVHKLGISTEQRCLGTAVGIPHRFTQGKSTGEMNPIENDSSGRVGGLVVRRVGVALGMWLRARGPHSDSVSVIVIGEKKIIKSAELGRGGKRQNSF